MNRKLISVLIFTLIALSSSLRTFAEPKFITPEEIHAGMIGYGKSVFQGTKVETFKVEVLGVLHKALADTDIILIRIDSPYLKKKQLGLVAGMSGSPVYFNGRLAGAIAYGWPFTPEAIAGVTPIQAMLRSSRDIPHAHVATGTPEVIKSAELTQVLQHDAMIRAFESPSLEPLDVSLSASGFNASGFNELKSIFPMTHVVPGGTKFETKNIPSLEPGQAIGAALMLGDLSLVATGTLTYRSGNQILGFGHPFLFLGDVDLPMVQSYVHYILPSAQLPFKFSSPIEEIGTVSQDRFYAIGGILGRKPHLVPMDITIQDQEREYNHQFHIQLIQHPDLTPRLAAVAIEQLIPSVSKLLGGATASLDYTVYFQNHPPLHRKNLTFSDQSIASMASAELLRSMSEVLSNDFENVNLSHLAVKVSIQPKLEVATLQKITLSKHHLFAGEPFSLDVYLKPYNGKMVKRTLNITIPADVHGNVMVGVAGGFSDEQLRKVMQQPAPPPLNVDQIIQQVQSNPSNNMVVVRLSYPRKSISWGGEESSNIPEAYVDLLKGAGLSASAIHSDGSETHYQVPWVVVGSEYQEINIDGRETSSPKQSPGGISTSSSFSHPLDTIETPRPVALSTSTSPLAATSSNLSASFIASSSPSGADEHKTEVASLGSTKDWQEGTLKNLAISPDGDLLLGPAIKGSTTFEENMLWTQARSQDVLYVGTANPGKIYKLTENNRDKALLYDPHSAAVTSLAVLSNGDLLAGATGGKLLLLSPTGKLKSSWKLRENYLWDVVTSNHQVYIATGSPQGKIYKLDFSEANPKPEEYYTSSQSHITALYAFPDGRLFAGTANHALLLQILPDGGSKTLYDLDETAILSLTGDSKGNLYVGTSGKGKVYVLDASNEMRELANLNEEDITWLGLQGDDLLAGTGIPARLYRITQKGSMSLLWDGKENEDVALKGEQNGEAKTLYVSGSQAKLLNISSEYAPHGEFLSQVIDTGGKSFWGKLQWYAKTSENRNLTIQTRSGNSATPDATWSDWSSSYLTAWSEITSPPARYLQFKVTFTKPASGETPALESVRFFWKPSNHPPSVSITSPHSGDIIGPHTVLKGKLSDKDGNTLKLELWDTNKIYDNFYPISKSKGEEEFSIPLTMLHKDGPINLKVIVSDSPSSGPKSALSDQVEIRNLIFDSTLPLLTITKTTSQNGVVQVEGTARDDTSYVKTVEYRINGGPWIETTPAHGLFDSQEEAFSFQLENSSTINRLDIRALDGADNEMIVQKDPRELPR